jgi:alpha-1,3-rhamnosyl/mannosyltransferase
VDRFDFFLTPRGHALLADLASARARIHSTASDSRWYYVPVGLPLAARRHPVDVLHATFTIAPWCPASSVVLTVHDLCADVHPDFFPTRVRARLRFLIRRGIKRADWIVVPSEATRRELAEYHGFPRERVTVIPHGIEPSIMDTGQGLAPADERTIRALPSEFVLYVGRFHARKNLPRLVEAMAALKARRGAATPLVIAGRDLWGEQVLRERIGALGMEADVIFTDYVGDALLARIYERAAVFAFPTLHEGFGIPALEAMAHGVPVVASNVSSMPEVCGDAAWLIDPLDVEALSHGLERVIDDSELRARLVAAGRERVREHTWERSASMHVAVYRDVASEKKAA